jgi:PAS domain S-box-containing protein
MRPGFHISVLVVYLVTALIWLWTFPFSKHFNLIDISTEGLYFLAAVISYLVVLRLRIKALEIGWPIFAYGTLLDLLDEFTRDKDFFNDPLEDLLNAFGLLLVAFGFYTAYKQRTSERDALHQSTRRLQTEALKLDAILSAIDDGVMALDSRGAVLFLNPAAAKIACIAPAEAVGRSIHEILPLEAMAEDQANLDQFVEILHAGVENQAQQDFGLQRPDQSDRRTIEVFGTQVGDPHSDGLNSILACRDVTQRRLLEQELLATSKEETMRLLSGGVAHDFNNILAAIQSWVALSRLRGDRTDGPDPLEKIEAACKRGKRLGSQLMSLARGGEPIKAPVRLAELVMDEAEFALRGSGVVCLFEIAEDLWPAEVDPGQISQLVHNLLLNARQAMPDGGKVWIELDNFAAEPHNNAAKLSGRFLRMIIRDNGPGIPAEHLNRIFEPYFTTRKTGSGIGLATSRAIVKRHGGSIDLSCPPSGGTHFTILLPIGLRKLGPLLIPAPAQPAGGRLLLVDDNIEFREPVALSLREKGYEVDVAENGRQAVEHYRQILAIGGHIDLIIMDLTMPGDIGGREAMHRILSLDPAARGIIASGYHEDPVMAHYKDHGFLGVITKPFELNELIDLIERTMQRNGS